MLIYIYLIIYINEHELNKIQFFYVYGPGTKVTLQYPRLIIFKI